MNNSERTKQVEKAFKHIKSRQESIKKRIKGRPYEKNLSLILRRLNKYFVIEASELTGISIKTIKMVQGRL